MKTLLLLCSLVLLCALGYFGYRYMSYLQASHGYENVEDTYVYDSSGKNIGLNEFYSYVPSKKYVKDYSECIWYYENVVKTKNLDVVRSNDKCVMYGIRKVSESLTNCPSNGRIETHRMCGDFPCSQVKYSCEVSFSKP